MEQGNSSKSTVLNNTTSLSYTLSDLMESSQSTEEPLVLIDAFIKGRKFKALIDTGASRNFISKRILEVIDLEVQKTGQKDLHFADGSTTTLNEKVYLKGEISNQWKFVNEFFVVEKLKFDLILGIP